VRGVAPLCARLASVPGTHELCVATNQVIDGNEKTRTPVIEARLEEGIGIAVEMFPPTRVMAGVTVAIVRAPGGVPIGFSGP